LPPEGLIDLIRASLIASKRLSQKKELSAVRCKLRNIAIHYSQQGTVWRGNGTNVLRYFPTQALNFAFKDNFKQMFGFKKSESFGLWVFGKQTLHYISFEWHKRVVRKRRQWGSRWSIVICFRVFT
jgi:hypothetical protein